MIASYHRPTTALVHLDRIKFNIEQVKHHIPKAAKTFAVVKPMLMDMVLFRWLKPFKSKLMVFVFLI